MLGAPSNIAAATNKAAEVTTYPSTGSSTANATSATIIASNLSPARGWKVVSSDAVANCARDCTSSAAPTTPSSTPTGNGTAAGPTASEVSGSRTASTMTSTAPTSMMAPNAADARTVFRSGTCSGGGVVVVSCMSVNFAHPNPISSSTCFTRACSA